MAQITGPMLIADIDLYQSYTAAPSGYNVGSLIYGADGKAFRLALFGELGVVADVYQSAAVDPQFDGMSVLAAALGSRNVVITNGTTTVTANQFDGGTIVVDVTPDFGNEYTILGHTTGASGVNITFTLDRPTRTAWTTATKATLRRSPWSGIVKAPTTLTGVAAGVAIYPAPNASYAWIQTKAVAPVLCDASVFAVGSDISIPGLTPGSIGVNVAGTGKSNTIGRAMKANASAKPIPVYLLID